MGDELLRCGTGATSLHEVPLKVSARSLPMAPQKLVEAQEIAVNCGRECSSWVVTLAALFVKVAT